MGKLLEIFGKGIAINITEVIWRWIEQSLSQKPFEQHRQRALRSIVSHLANYEHSLANQKLSVYLAEYPDCCLGRMAAAAIYLRQNDIENALQQTRSIYLRQPTNTLALYLMGYYLERLGRVSEAKDFYQDCIKFKSHLQLPRQRLAAIALRNGQLQAVVEEYNALLKEYPDDTQSRILLGYAFLALEKWQEAIDEFNYAIISHPDNFFQPDNDDRVEQLAQSGLYDKAIEQIENHLEQFGPQLDLLIRLADLYSRAGCSEQAISYFEQILQLYPNSLEATIKLGIHYLRCRKFALAGEQFNQAAEINEQIVDAYLGLASAYVATHAMEQARQTFLLAWTIQQNSTLLFSEAATLHFQALLQQRMENQHPEQSDQKVIALIQDVIRAFEQHRRQDSNRADIHYKYGLLMMVENDCAKALEAFEKTLQLNPIHYRAHFKRVLCLYQQGKVEQALELLNQSQLPPAALMESYYRTAILYCDKVAFAKALRLVQARLQSPLDNSHSHIHLETILENLGLVDRAFNNWNRIAETAQVTCL